MESDRWKKASLAIDAMIRGLEDDQIAFQYDETAYREITCLAAGSAFAARDGRVELTVASSFLLRERPGLPGVASPLKETTTAAYL